MSDRQIKIRLVSEYDGKGVVDAKVDVSDFSRALSVFGKSAQGSLRKVIDLGKAVATGGIWQIGASLIMTVGSTLSKFWNRAEHDAQRAAKESAKAAEAINSALSRISSSYSSGISSSDKYVARLEKQIETTKRLATAEMELARQRALASGDKIGVARASEEIDAIAAKSAQQLEEARRKGYERRRALAVEAERNADRELDKAAAEVERINARRQAMLGDPGRRGDRSVSYRPGDESSAWGRANREAVGWAGLHNGLRLAMLAENRGGDWNAMIKDYRDKVFRGEMGKLFKSDEWKESTDDLKAAEKVSNRAADVVFEMRQNLAEMDAEEKRRLDENAAKRVETQAKAIAECERLDKQVAERRRGDRQRELADKIRDHQRLLAAVRSEDAAARADSAAAESKLQQAWGWYRDKNSMAAQLQEEKANAQAEKQFEKDFRRLQHNRKDWRTADNLSLGDEAVRRVALAREEADEASRFAELIAQETQRTADILERIEHIFTETSR